MGAFVFVEVLEGGEGAIAVVRVMARLLRAFRGIGGSRRMGGYLLRWIYGSGSCVPGRARRELVQRGPPSEAIMGYCVC